MTTLSHARLSIVTRPALFVEGQEHKARCTCGWTTAWLTSLNRTELAMSSHVILNAGLTFEVDLGPRAIETRRRLDAHAVEVAIEAARALEAEQRRAKYSDGGLLLAAVFCVVVMGGSALFLWLW